MARLASLFALASLVFGMRSKRKRTSGGSVESITPATHRAHVLTETDNTAAVPGCATQSYLSRTNATLRDIDRTISSINLLSSSNSRTRIPTNVDTFPSSNSTHNADFSSPSGSISAPHQTLSDNGCASRPLLASKKDRVLPGVSTTVKSFSNHSYGTRTASRFDRDDDADNTEDVLDAVSWFENDDGNVEARSQYMDWLKDCEFCDPIGLTDKDMTLLFKDIDLSIDCTPHDAVQLTDEKMAALLQDIDWSDYSTPFLPVELTDEYRTRVPIRIHTKDGPDIVYDGAQTRWSLLYDWKSDIIARVEQLAPGIVPSTVRRERLCGNVYTHAGVNAAWSVNVQQWLSAVVHLHLVEREAALAVHALLHALVGMFSRLHALGYGLEPRFDIAKDVVIDCLTREVRILRPERIVTWTSICMEPAELLKQVLHILKALNVRGNHMAQTVLQLSVDTTELEVHPLGRNILATDVSVATVSRAKLSHPALTCDAYAALLPDAASYAALKLDYGGIVLVLEFMAKAEDVRATIQKHVLEAVKSAEINNSMRFVCTMVHPTGDMFRVGVIFGISDAFIPLSAVTEDLSSRAPELVLGVSRSLAFARILCGAVGGFISPSTLLFCRNKIYDQLFCVPWVYSSVQAANRPISDPSIPLSLQTWLFDQLLGKPIQRVRPSTDLVALAAVYVHMRRLPLNLYSVCDADGAAQLRPVRAGLDVPHVNPAAILLRNGNLALAIPECTAFTETDALILNFMLSMRLSQAVTGILGAQISLSPALISVPLSMNRMGTFNVHVERVYALDRGSHIVFAGRNAWNAVHKLTGEPFVVIPSTDGELTDLAALVSSCGGITNDGSTNDLPAFAVNVGAVVAHRNLYTKVISDAPRLCLPRGIFVLHNTKAAIAWSVYDPKPFVPLSSILPLSLSGLERAAAQLSETLAKLAEIQAYPKNIEIEDIYAIAADGTHDVYMASFSRVQLYHLPTMTRARSAVALEVFLVRLAIHSNIALTPELGQRLNVIISASLGPMRFYMP